MRRETFHAKQRSLAMDVRARYSRKITMAATASTVYLPSEVRVGSFAAIVVFYMSDPPAEFFFEDAFGFPTGQALVHEFDGNTNCFAKAFGKTRGLFRHFAGCAVEAKGKPDDDLSHL